MYNHKLESVYRRFRAIGQTAQQAIHSARTLQRWERFAEVGLVRVQLEESQERYFDVYGEPETVRERADTLRYLERWGCYTVYTEYRETVNSDVWHAGDSIGMCIYEKPECPYDNDYVIDLMSETLRRFGHVSA